MGIRAAVESALVRRDKQSPVELIVKSSWHLAGESELKQECDKGTLKELWWLSKHLSWDNNCG